MARLDRIEIEQGGRTLRGEGSLRITRGVPIQGGWSVLPTVEGVVTFDERVTFAELQAMDSAEVRVVLASGAHHAFRQAVVMRQEAHARPDTYAFRLDCYEVVP